MTLIRKNTHWYCLILLATVVTSSDACGITTHISIGQEALHFFKSPNGSSIDYASIIRKHQDAFVAGLPYPDTMYNPVCFFGWLHDIAEDTHWVEFLKASINYIRRKYPQPWNEETEKLIAFLFGIASHQVADIPWHSLGIKEGFISTMAKLNFHGQYQPAHTVADFGGDMLTLFSGDIEHAGVREWYVPLDDLHNIYAEFYAGKRTVSKVTIELCSKLSLIEYILESRAGTLIFKPFVKRSPFLLNQMHNYFLGGIHDMASWSTLIWEETAYMLDHGTNSCYLPHNPLYIKCNNITATNRVKPHSSLKNYARKFPLLETEKWNMSYVSSVRTKKGIYIHPKDEVSNMINQKVDIKKRKVKQLKTNSNSIYSESPYAETGRRFAKIKIMGEPCLAVSAPNYGKPGSPQLGQVLIIKVDKLLSVKESGKSLEDISEFTLQGEEKMSKFGWDMTSMFYNRDEYEDLVVSAPVLGDDLSWNYFGKVYVYYGSKHGMSSKPNVTLSYEESSQLTNFGYSLASCSSQLFIGSPFHSKQRGVVRTINAKDGSMVDTFGTYNTAWYGYHIACGSVHGKDILAVGSPTYKSWDKKQSLGYVDLYIGEQMPRLFGDGEFSEFGSHISFGKPFGKDDIVVAISSPGKTITGTLLGIPYTIQQAGEVTLYNLTALMNRSAKTVLAYYQGDRSYGRFGAHIQFVDTNSDGRDELIISSPLRSKDITELLYGGNEGVVYIFDSRNMHGDVTNNCSRLRKPCPDEPASKVFYGTEAQARFGSAFEVISDRHGRSKIVVSASYSSKRAFRAGMLSIYDLENKRRD